MKNKDKRIDAYIEKSQDFAKPILKHLRELIHEACQDTEETIKWGFPHFDYKSEMMCSMAAFKNHCAFGFWKATIMSDPDKILSVNKSSAMGQFGQIKKLSDLPPDKIIVKYIKAAAKLNDDGIRLTAKSISPGKKEVDVPEYFEKILNKNNKAKNAFYAFSYSHKKEYVQWITEAKTEATRMKRIGTAIEWLSEGKKRNWKYEKC